MKILSLLYLPHDGDRGLSFGLCHSVLYQVIHVLIIEQADQVKGTETGRTAQSQVPDNHGAEKGDQIGISDKG